MCIFHKIYEKLKVWGWGWGRVCVRASSTITAPARPTHVEKKGFAIEKHDWSFIIVVVFSIT